jgi:hypothetical protein
MVKPAKDKPLDLSKILLPLLFTSSAMVSAATLPEHAPLSILIIADAVNPHRLADADLTQPGDLVPALTAADSGLNIDSISMVDSQCIDDALGQLASESTPDVVLYFAHRGAAYCNGDNAQPDLTQLLEHGLQSGLGLVVLHHGLYVDFTNRGIKQDLLNLIGAQSDSIEWNTTTGQRVINVAGDHFIPSNGITYGEEHRFTGMPGTPAGTYPAFTNTPDELYEVTTLNVQDDEDRTLLFVTDSGTPRVLGYVLRREGWRGLVAAYQPGEYQPNALDDRSGPNFQILVNAIYHAATTGRAP